MEEFGSKVQFVKQVGQSVNSNRKKQKNGRESRSRDIVIRVDSENAIPFAVDTGIKFPKAEFGKRAQKVVKTLWEWKRRLHH